MLTNESSTPPRCCPCRAPVYGIARLCFWCWREERKWLREQERVTKGRSLLGVRR